MNLSQQESEDYHTEDIKLDDMDNTQQVMELPMVKEKKSASKGKGFGKTTMYRHKRAVKALDFYKWLKNYWDTVSTVKLMGKFITNLKTHALQNRRPDLAKLIHPMNQVMKEFILHCEKQKLNLRKISWDNFEQWALGAGLSTMFGNGQSMGWGSDFDSELYNIYGKTYLQCQEQITHAETSEEEELNEDEGYSVSRNTTITSMSSMTARTPGAAAGVDTCGISRNIPHGTVKKVTFDKSGAKSIEPSTSKSKMNTKNSKSVSAKPHKRGQIIEELEDSEEEELIAPKNKKMKRTAGKIMNLTTDESSDAVSDNLEDLLDGVVQQQCLRQTTGSISQTMCLKHLESLITLNSRGERGTKVIKLEIYPYADCLKKPKTEWWKTALCRSTFLSYSEDSRVQKLVDNLQKEAFKQIRETKNVRIESKSAGSRSG